MKLVFSADRCTACRLCEMACSLAQEGDVNPRNARLKIVIHYDSRGIAVEGRLCDGCGRCVGACAPEALELTGGRIELDVAKCTGCSLCIDACPRRAIVYGDDYKPRICNFCRGAPECARWCPRDAIGLEAS